MFWNKPSNSEHSRTDIIMIRPFPLEDDKGEFGKLFTTAYNLERKGYDSAHIAFNAHDTSLGIPMKIMLFEATTSDINITKGQHIFGHGTRRSSLWTITLKYSPKQFDKLVEYGNKYELSLDIMFRNSRDAPERPNYISILKTQITQNISHELKLCNENMCGYSKINFKKGGIKVIKKEEKVIVKIALLENGFYEIYNYTVVDE